MKLVDFEHAWKKDESLSCDLTLGTPGFAPKESLVNSLTNSLREKILLKDIYALGGILLATYYPRWYQKLVQNDYMSLSDWGQNAYAKKLPTQAYKIYEKACLMGADFYCSIDEFVEDIQCLRKA